MSKIIYFLRRNNWILELILVPSCAVLIITLPGSILVWLGEGTAPVKWLMWLAISFIVTFAAFMLAFLLTDDSFCPKCGRIGVKVDIDPSSYITTYKCGHCENIWKVDSRVLGSDEHQIGCQCYDCCPYEGYRGPGH